MQLIDENSLIKWLDSTVRPICEADPSTLAVYILALLKKDKSEEDLKQKCLEELDIFLQKETKSFVDKLFETLRHKSYLPSSSQHRQNSPYKLQSRSEKDGKSESYRQRQEKENERSYKTVKSQVNVVTRSNRRDSRTPEKSSRMKNHRRENRYSRHDREVESPPLRCPRKRSSSRASNKSHNNYNYGNNNYHPTPILSNNNNNNNNNNIDNYNNNNNDNEDDDDDLSSIKKTKSSRKSDSRSSSSQRSSSCNLDKRDRVRKKRGSTPPKGRGRDSDYFKDTDERGQPLIQSYNYHPTGVPPYIPQAVQPLPNVARPPPSLPYPRFISPPPHPQLLTSSTSFQYMQPGSYVQPHPPPSHVPLANQQIQDPYNSYYQIPPFNHPPPVISMTTNNYNPNESTKQTETNQQDSTNNSNNKDQQNIYQTTRQNNSNLVQVQTTSNLDNQKDDDDTSVISSVSTKRTYSEAQLEKPVERQVERAVKKTSSNATLILKKIPKDLNTITNINSHFSKFGYIINLQVNYDNDPQAALVEFASWNQANSAIKCKEPFLNDRFIKINWYNPDKTETKHIDPKTMPPPGGHIKTRKVVTNKKLLKLDRRNINKAPNQSHIPTSTVSSLTSSISINNNISTSTNITTTTTTLSTTTTTTITTTIQTTTNNNFKINLIKKEKDVYNNQENKTPINQITPNTVSDPTENPGFGAQKDLKGDQENKKIVIPTGSALKIDRKSQKNIENQVLLKKTNLNNNVKLVDMYTKMAEKYANMGENEESIKLEKKIQSTNREINVLKIQIKHLESPPSTKKYHNPHKLNKLIKPKPLPSSSDNSKDSKLEIIPPISSISSSQITTNFTNRLNFSQNDIKSRLTWTKPGLSVARSNVTHIYKYRSYKTNHIKKENNNNNNNNNNNFKNQFSKINTISKQEGLVNLATTPLATHSIDTSNVTHSNQQSPQTEENILENMEDEVYGEFLTLEDEEEEEEEDEETRFWRR